MNYVKKIDRKEIIYEKGHAYKTSIRSHRRKPR